MEILGTRVKLEQFTQSDWPIFKELNTSPQVMRHVYDPFPEDVAREIFESRLEPWNENSDGWLSLSINGISTKEKLGVIGLKVTNHEAKIAEVGYMLTEKAQGKGFASESLGLLVEFAFANLKLNKLVAACSTKNSGSYKLLEKLGFVREGCLAQNSIINNQYVDDYVYALLKPAQ